MERNQNILADKHSPGPWRWSNYRLCSPTGRIICNAAEKGRDITGDDEDEANQKLIHFAPEVLAALKELYLQTANYIKINHLGDVHHNRDMQMARDVLAKL